MAAQLVEEGDKSPADVFFSQDAGALGAVAKEGLFADAARRRARQGAGRLPVAERRVGRRDRRGPGCSSYNADQVPEADLPASVFDLTDPQWKGKVGIAPTNASFQAFVTALRVQHGEAKAKEFLTGLKANDAADPATTTSQIVDEVNDGKLAVGLVNHYYVVRAGQGAGHDGRPARRPSCTSSRTATPARWSTSPASGC